MSNSSCQEKEQEEIQELHTAVLAIDHILEGSISLSKRKSEAGTKRMSKGKLLQNKEFFKQMGLSFWLMRDRNDWPD